MTLRHVLSPLRAFDGARRRTSVSQQFGAGAEGIMVRMRNLTSSSSVTGVALVALASTLWGTTGTAQSLGAQGLAPYWVGAAQLAVASLFFAVVLWATGRGQSVAAVLPRPAALGVPARWFWLAAAGTAGYSISFYAGVKLAGVGVGTAVAIGSAPIWAGLIQALLLRQPLSRLWWLGTAVSVGGGVAMVLSKQGGASALSVPGLLLCLLAGLSYASYALVNKRLVGQVPTRVVNLYVFSGAAVLAAPAALLLAGWPQFTASSLMVVVYLGLVVSGLAYVLFSNGLRHISGPTGVTLTLIEPVAAFLLAVWIVGEHQPVAAWLGLLTVLAGLMLVIGAEVRGPRVRRPVVAA